MRPGLVGSLDSRGFAIVEWLRGGRVRKPYTKNDVVVSGVDVPRDAPVFTMAAVRRLTGLTDRQIRYYDQVGLVVPRRTRGNRRLYSQADVEALNYVKRLLADGHRVAEAREAMARRAAAQARPVPERLMRSSDAVARFPGAVSLRSVYPLENRPELLKTLDDLRERARKKTDARPDGGDRSDRGG